MHRKDLLSKNKIKEGRNKNEKCSQLFEVTINFLE